MLDLIINSQGVTATSLIAKLESNGHHVDTLALPECQDDLQSVKAKFDAMTEAGTYYRNIYLNLTDGVCEVQQFNQDSVTAIDGLQNRLTQILKTLKYGSQHLARTDGGRIWVMCYDHSIKSSIDAPCNPIVNNAVVAAVQSVAKEVARFDVKVNVFLIHPPKESLEPAQWRAAKGNLKVYNMKYKPQSAEQVSELINMYGEVSQLATTGGVIPVGTGIAMCNI